MKAKLTKEARKLAALFHEIYERLAPEYGYTTREDTRALDFNSANGKLMVAVAKEIIEKEEFEEGIEKKKNDEVNAYCYECNKVHKTRG